jgi:cell division ATPase FtsA
VSWFASDAFDPVSNWFKGVGVGWSAGMVAGLIRDIPTVAELVNRIIDEARGIIQARLAGMV